MNELQGKPVDVSLLNDVFQAQEGELNFYYGMIGSGKTYGATADAWEALRRGEVVYTTWPIKVNDYDDRNEWFYIIKNLLLFRKRYYKIPMQKNLHYIDVEKGQVDGEFTFDPKRPKAYIDFLNTLNHCTIFIDEAWRVIDSYQGTNFSLDGRNLVLVTRHKFRTINLIAQRPTSVQVTARANMNRFYKFVKLGTWPWIRFARYEFQEMAGETVDESQEPISIKTYWGKSKIFDSYNSYYYGDLYPVHEVQFEAYDFTTKERFQLLWKKLSETYTKFREKTLDMFDSLYAFLSKTKRTRSQKILSEITERTSIDNDLPF